MSRQRRPSLRTDPSILRSLRVAGAYALLGGVWILTSDKVASLLAPSTADLSWFQTLKGWFFVFVTAMLLFGLVLKQLRLLESESARRQAADAERIRLLDEAVAANQQALEVADRLALATASAGIGIWSIDLGDRALWWDERMYAIHGLFRDTFAGTVEAWQELVHPDDRARSGAAMGLDPVDDVASIEYRVIWPDGSVHDVECHAMVQRSAAGQPVRLVGTNRDITTRRHALRSLAQSEAWLQRAEMVARIGYWTIELDTERTSLSEGTRRILGCSNEDGELTTAKMREMVGSSQLPALEAAAYALINEGRAFDREFTLKHPDGRIVEVRTLIEFEPAGRLLFGVTQDITEFKQMQRQLLRTQRLESVGRLASGVAHDLNNIMAPMLLAPALLRPALRDPELLELLDTVESATRRGAAVIRQLLAFGRGTDASHVVVDLGRTVREMERIMRDTFPKNIVVRIDGLGGPRTVMGDATQLHQVLMNLCVNAADAMPEGGTLTIALSQETVEVAPTASKGLQPGDYIVLTVSDTGHGIPEADLERIFDPFFTTKAVGRGTGLGLSTVIGIVQSHLGSVQVSSGVGKGTTFRVIVPAASRAEAVDGLPRASGLPRGRGELVLVVDDEEAVRVTTRRVLEAAGYRVTFAGDGGEAMDEFRKWGEEVKLVITDMLMPTMAGPAFIRALRGAGYDPGLIVASGHDATEGLPPDLASEVDQVLRKPFELQALLETVRQVIDRHSR